MKRKRIVSLALALLLIAGAASALAASAGSAEDPLISLSYITDTYIPSLLNKAKTAIISAFAPLRDELGLGTQAPGGAAPSDGFSAYLLFSGGSVALRTGGSAMLLSGEATLSISSGAVVDVTNGVEAGSGEIARNTRLLGAEDCDATITVPSGAVLAVLGNATVTGGESAAIPFADVKYADWFYIDVAAAYNRSLINGMSATSFEPGGQLTLAQAIKLAACLHQRYYTDAVTLRNSESGKWYQSYVDYAIANGILSGPSSEAEYNSPITRTRFVSLFYKALPSSEYKAINSIADGAIPDVGMSDPSAYEIYAFYRAGILMGNDKSGSFLPASDIKRSEVAAILTRMYNAASRKTISLP